MLKRDRFAKNYQMTETEQMFYCKIGLISTGFARLEHYIREIIHLLMQTDSEFVSQIAIQDNSTSQNQKLMMRLNKYRDIETEKIENLNKKIDGLRINRNLFIHGEWKILEIEGQEAVFVCSTTKVTFKKVTYGLVKMRNTHDDFTVHDLDNGINQIQECIEMAGKIIETLEKH
jgi:hypothetical protein